MARLEWSRDEGRDAWVTSNEAVAFVVEKLVAPGIPGAWGVSMFLGLYGHNPLDATPIRFAVEFKHAMDWVEVFAGELAVALLLLGGE